MKKRNVLLTSIIAITFLAVLSFFVINNRVQQSTATSYGVLTKINSFSNTPNTSNHDIQNTTTPSKDKLVSINITLTNTTKSTIKFDPSQFILNLPDGIQYQPYLGPIPSKSKFYTWSKLDSGSIFVTKSTTPKLLGRQTIKINIGFAIPIESDITKDSSLSFVGLNQGTKFLKLSLDTH